MQEETYNEKCHIEVQCPLTLTGCIENICVEDEDCPPTSIIKSTDSFHVKVYWWVDGTVVSLLGGEFDARACFESIGPGDEKSFSASSVLVKDGKTEYDPKDPCAPKSDGGVHPLRKYFSVDIEVPATSLAAGPYELISVVTYKNNGVPGNIAGYSDEKVIQIYDPNPAQP
jgi:hypothetical protein